MPSMAAEVMPPAYPAPSPHGKRFLISLSNKKDHCVYNRAMYIFLIVLPIFNFLDATLLICVTDLSYMITVSVMFGLTALITAYLAIRHFVQISKRRLERGRE